MALWGNTDALASAPKYVAPTRAVDMSSAGEVAANVITNHGHGFITGDPVTYTSTAAATNLVSGTVYYVIRLTSSTFSLAATPAAALVPTPIVLTNDGAAADTFQKTPDNLYFVDISEADSNKSTGLGTGGWTEYTTYTDGHGNTRNKSEVLIAMARTAAEAGDTGILGSDDDVVFDTLITITTQPLQSDATVDITGLAAATLTIAASASPAQAVTYDWQSSADGSTGWATATVAGSTTTTTLSIVDTDGDYVAGRYFRCVVSSAGALAADPVVSNSVVLTQSA